MVRPGTRPLLEASVARSSGSSHSDFLPLFIGGSLLLGFGALRIPAWRRTVDAIPLSTLVGVQFFRLIGLLFVILYSVGTLPGYFALPAGWGDVAVGTAALLVGYALLRDAPGARGLSIGFNILGLSDLIVAVGTGTGFLVPLLFDGLRPGPTTPMTSSRCISSRPSRADRGCASHLFAACGAGEEREERDGRKQIGEAGSVDGTAGIR
jgi:hypothetical protein